MLKLSHTVGYIPKKGKTYNCSNVAIINPDPTSMMLSISSLIYYLPPQSLRVLNNLSWALHYPHLKI
jgi:hypothetical protein